MSDTICKQCRPTLGSLVKKHRPDQCPLMAASYCGVCASYGHSPADCPDRLTWAHRTPQFMEQLIPAHLLEEYGIRTRTPLAAHSGVAKPASECIWEIVETGESLRVALTNLGIKPMICQEKGKKEQRELIENKKRLQKAADQRGYKIIYVPPYRDEEDEADS